MILLILCFTILIFSLIVAFFGNIGKEFDLMHKRFNQIQGSVDIRLDDELSKSFVQRFIVPAMLSFREILQKKTPKKVVNGDEKLETELKLAGLSITPNEFVTIRYIVMGCCIVAAFVALVTIRQLSVKLLVTMFLLVLGILLPRYFLKTKITVRKNRIKNQIPDVMDILCVSLEAGLGFDGALLKISSKIKGPFVDELLILYREIKMGRPRKEALRSLADRNAEIEEIKTFSAAVIQAETLGISIKNVLKSQADQLRTARRELAEEKGQKAPIKMMLPLVLFVFPVIFIILLGPTIIQVTGK